MRTQSCSVGFTLVEMAIVIAIIALLTGGVITAQKMTNKARTASVASDVASFAGAMEAFKAKYGAVPGDMVNATSFFPGVANGNGNGKLDSAESLLFWQHLSASGLLKQQMNGTTNSPGAGVPSSELQGGYAVREDANLGVVFELTGYNGTTPGLAVMTPKDARSIDERYDDGDPLTGKIRGSDGSNAAGGCVSGGVYLVSSSAKACQLKMAANASVVEQNDSQKQALNVACGNIGETRKNASCPTGYAGEITETCGKSGTWQVSHFNCAPVNCGGGVYNQTRIVGCPAGYTSTGALTQICNAGGTWVTTVNTCVPEVGGACTTGALRTLVCPAGQTGSVEQSCVASVWSTTSNTCASITCGGSAVGATQTAACPANYTGNVTQICTNSATWENLKNTCAPNTGSCTYGVDTTRTLTCPGGQTGSVVQTCRDGATDNWITTSNSCKYVTCGGKPVGYTRESTATCPAGQIGVVTEVCQDDGTWLAGTTNCTVDNASAPPAACATAGSEFRANTTTSASQRYSSVAVQSDGSYLVVWGGNGSGGGADLNGIFGQFYTAGGVASGTEFIINTNTGGVQQKPDVAVLANGNYVVVWEGLDANLIGVQAKVISAAGATVVSEFSVNTYTTNNQYDPHVAALSGGEFAISWTSTAQDGSGEGVYMKTYTAAGVVVSAETRVDSVTTGNQEFSDVVKLPGGGFYVFWEYDDSGTDRIYAKRYNASGIVQGGQFMVNTYVGNYTKDPSAALLGDGNVLVVWHSHAQEVMSGIYGQVLNASGAKVGLEFHINTYTADNQREPSIGLVGSNEVLVAWSDAAQDGDNWGVYGQVLDYSTATPTLSGSELHIASYSTLEQVSVVVHGNGVGKAVVTWSSNGQDGSNFGIYAKEYTCSTGGFTPISIPGAMLWLDGDDLDGDGAAEGTSESGLSGTNVLTWADKSGSGYHATTSTGTNPYAVVTGGKYGIAFNGGGRFSASVPFAAMSNTTIFTVLYLGGAHQMLYYFGDEGYSLMDTSYLGGHTLGQNTGRGDVTGKTITTLTNWYTISSQFTNGNGGAYRQWVNGTEPSPYNTYCTYPPCPGSSPFSNGMLIGGGGSGWYDLTGKIAEIIAYNRSLTTTERQQVESYLCTKWGVSGC
jgi:type II secretory pathway pseudopilin PulG